MDFVLSLGCISPFCCVASSCITALCGSVLCAVIWSIKIDIHGNNARLGVVAVMRQIGAYLVPQNVLLVFIKSNQ